MQTPDEQVVIELIHEEIAKLLFFETRHRRWSMEVDNNDLARFHRKMADTLKDIAQMDQELIDDWKGK